MTVIIGALGLAAALGQERHEEVGLVAWEEILRESSKLETELGLGLIRAAESEEAVRALIERGDRLLEASAVPGVGGALESARAAVMAATVQAVEAISVGKWRLVGPEEQAGGTVDPWAGLDQECGYFPEKLGPARLFNDSSKGLPDVEEGELCRLIPERYRLAEALGLGKNRVVCQPRFIDPIQVNRPGLDNGEGVTMLARLHCELTGQFVSSVKGEPVRTEATFRLAVISQGRLPAGTNRMSARHERRDIYGVENFSVDAGDLLYPGPRNPWVNEALPAAAAKRGWLIEPVQGGATTGESWVAQALGEKLQELQGVVLGELRTDPDIRDRLVALRTSLGEYQSAVDRAVPTEGEGSGSETTAIGGLQAIDLEALLDSGSLDGAVLRRVVPATGLALDSTRRALQVEMTPLELRSKAASLAGALNSLARWTLR